MNKIKILKNFGSYATATCPLTRISNIKAVKNYQLSVLIMTVKQWLIVQLISLK